MTTTTTTTRTLRAILGMLLIALALSTQLGNGCLSDSGGSSGTRDDYTYDADRPRPQPLGDRPRPNRIPRNADLVSEGREKLLWRADMNGRYYVYDVTRDRVVYDAPILRGQELYLDAKRDRISLDGNATAAKDIERDSLHRIYFVASRGSGSGSNVGRDPNLQGPQRPPQQDQADVALPRNAERLATGRGNLAVHGAPDDGTVYVYDENADRVVYQHALRRGNSFQIFPADDYVNVNSRRAASVRLSPDGRYSLYFVERK